MFPAFIILKILLYNILEIPKYFRLTKNKIIQKGLRKTFNLETTQWLFVVNLCKKISKRNAIEMYNRMLYSSNLDIVKWGIELGANDINNCLLSANPEVNEYGLQNGATRFDHLLTSKHMSMVLKAIDLGTTEFYKCNASSNLEVVKLGLIKEEQDNSYVSDLLSSDNMDIVKYALEEGENDYDLCLLSNNLKVVKFGLSKGATLVEYLLGSNNFKIFKLGVKLMKAANLKIRYNISVCSNNFKIVKTSYENGGNYSSDLGTLNNNDYTNPKVLHFHIKKHFNKFQF